MDLHLELHTCKLVRYSHTRVVMKLRPARWDVMCIPGRADDGSDSWWYLFDRNQRVGKRGVVAEEVGSGEISREAAHAEARRRNRGDATTPSPAAVRVDVRARSVPSRQAFHPSTYEGWIELEGAPEARRGTTRGHDSWSAAATAALALAARRGYEVANREAVERSIQERAGRAR
jgi:hypothetical protein